MSEPIVRAVRSALAEAGDPNRAVQQQRYMKSALPYRGLTSPELRTLMRPLLGDHPVESSAQWDTAIRQLWDGASHREEWYAAIALARHRLYRAWREDPAALELFEHLVRTGAWWDVVDEIAAHLVGGVLATHRDEVTGQVMDWAECDALWLRRTAILAQLRHGEDTDTVLLRQALDANLEGTVHGREFFIRKAIGWALRQYARTDAAWVRAYVDSRADLLSGLSRREALKHLGQTG